MKSINCPNCGIKLNKGALFCGACGQKIIQPTEKIKIEANSCPKCNREFEKDETFCAECGIAITADITKNKQTSQKRITPKSKPQPIAAIKSNPSKKKKKGGVLRTIGKIVVGFIAFVIVGSVVLYYMGDDVTETPMKVREANAVLTDATTYPIVPSPKEQVFSYTDRIKITLPPDFTFEKQSLAISNAAVDKAIMVEDSEPLMLVDLTLDDGKQPTKPVEISYKYNKTDLNPNFTAEEQLAAYRWDEEGGGWINLPIQIDEKKHEVSILTDHLSIFTVGLAVVGIIATVKGYVEYKDLKLTEIYITPEKNFRILYSKKQILQDGSLMNRRWKKKYHSSKFKYSSKHPLYIQDIGQFLEQALEKYTQPFFSKYTYGFRNPAGEYKNAYWGTFHKMITVKMDSYLHDITWPVPLSDPFYDKLQERLYIPTSRCLNVKSAKLTLAHELFHAIQAQYYGASGMMNPFNQWWLEATAEYASFEVAWPKPLNGIDDQCGSNYLSYPINERGDKVASGHGWGKRHYEYVSAIWIKYLIDSGFDLKRMIEYDASDSPLSIKSLENYLWKTHKSSIDDIYREFAAWMIFSAKGTLNHYSLTTKNLENEISIKEDILKLGEGKEVNYSFKMQNHFTTKLWTIRIEKKNDKDILTPDVNIPKKIPLIVNVEKKSAGTIVDIFIIPKDQRNPKSTKPVKRFHTANQSKIVMVEEGDLLCIMTTQGSIANGSAEVIVRDVGITLEIDPPELANVKAKETNYFTIRAKNIPKEIEKVEFVWNYNDGSKQGIENFVRVSGGEAQIKISHSYGESDKEEIYPLKVVLKDDKTGVSLAAAEALITVPIEGPTVFITERHITGPPGATFDVEALASPENTYNFVWTVEGMAEEFTQTGKKSGIAPVINKVGEYTYTVKLYSLDGTFLDEDRVTIYVESDKLNNEGIDGIVSLDDENTRELQEISIHVTYAGSIKYTGPTIMFGGEEEREIYVRNYDRLGILGEFSHLDSKFIIKGNTISLIKNDSYEDNEIFKLDLLFNNDSLTKLTGFSYSYTNSAGFEKMICSNIPFKKNSEYPRFYKFEGNISGSLKSSFKNYHEDRDKTYIEELIKYNPKMEIEIYISYF